RESPVPCSGPGLIASCAFVHLRTITSRIAQSTKSFPVFSSAESTTCIDGQWAETCFVEGRVRFLLEAGLPGAVSMAIEVQGVAPLVQVFDMPQSIHFYRD